MGRSRIRERMPSMKILAVNGSPRRDGNTAKLLHEIVKGAEAQGAEATYYDLVDMEVKDCLACMHCKKEAECAQDDDMGEIYDRIKAADVVVLGSPVYMGGETGQTKCFVDRLYALLSPGQEGRGSYSTRLEGKKKVIVLFTCGRFDGDKVYNYLNTRYFNTMVHLLGFSDIRTFIIGGMNPTVDGRSLPQAKVALAECKRFIGSEMPS
jgi:multimeric flavodoxin WrbA